MTIKGWCPGALRPMTSGDGLILRVRPPLSRLAPAQARGLAALAQGCGAGVLHLTNRANLQIRGVRPADLPALHAGLARLGLLDPSPEAEARRNLILCPFHDAAEQTVAARLGEALRAADGLALPAKFGFAVGASVAADIRILSLGEGMALAPQAAALGLPVATDRAVPAAMAMARWFIASGGVGPDGRGRMAAQIIRRRSEADAPKTEIAVTEIAVGERETLRPQGLGRGDPTGRRRPGRDSRPAADRRTAQPPRSVDQAEALQMGADRAPVGRASAGAGQRRVREHGRRRAAARHLRPAAREDACRAADQARLLVCRPGAHSRPFRCAGVAAHGSRHRDPTTANAGIRICA